MKKIFYFLSALALFACDKAEDFDQPNQGGVASGDLPEVIYATVADNNDKSDKTRTVVAEDGKSILWNMGDNITYFFDCLHGAQYKYQGEDGVAEAEFDKITEGTRDFGLSRSYAVYPFEVNASCIQDNGVEKLQVFYPAEQNYMPNSFGRGANVMVAAGEHTLDYNLRFRNACGYLVIKLYGENITVKSIELTALGGEKIAGTGLITASHGADPVVAMTDQGRSTIMLNCGSGVTLGADAANATEFWFAMPPTTFEEGFKILVAPTTGLAFEMQTSKKVEITRNEIQPMAALQYTPNAQTPNQFVYTKSAEPTTPIAFDEDEQPFNVAIKSHYYDARINKLVIQCEAPITEIKDEAFRGSYNNGYFLTSVSLPSQLEVIGSRAFYSNQIQEIVIPSSVTLIKDRALRCSGLKRITFLWSEETLQIRAYDGVATPEQSGNGAFRDENLEYISIDRNIEYTDEDGEENGNISAFLGLFTNTSSTTNVVIGPNMSTIPESMFAGVNMEKLVIPGNITSIGKNNFYNCKSLEEIVFEPSHTNASLTMDGTYNTGDTGPFYSQYNEDNLERISLNREIDYILEGIDGDDEGLFSGRSALRTVELGEQVKTISDYMFAASAALTSVTIPSSVTYIGNNAFEGCTALTSVSVSESGATMGNNVFKNCDALTTATLGAQTIGTGVLYDCDKLETVTIKGTVNTIGNDAFYSCGAIKNVNLEPSTTGRDLTLGYQTYGTDEQGPFYDGVLETVNWYRNISYTLANAGSADQDDEGLFSKMSKLTSVNIGEQVRTIPPYTFANSGLTSITIPANVSTIGADAFRDCDALHTVNIESSTNPIKIHTQTGDWGTFYDSPLSTINLDREVNYVNAAGSAFTLDDWDEGVFANEEYNGDFTATVTLGANVKTIWPWMFSCVRMQNVTIPASVTSIGKEAFSYCYILTEVTCMGTTPPTLGEDAFYDSDELERIYVPSGSLSNYQSKWSQYKGKLYQK